MQIAGLEKTLMFDIEGTFLGEVRLCLNVNSQNLEYHHIFKIAFYGLSTISHSILTLHTPTIYIKQLKIISGFCRTSPI